MLFYASDLPVRKMAMDIVTRFEQPESYNVIKNPGWLWDFFAVIAV